MDVGLRAHGPEAGASLHRALGTGVPQCAAAFGLLLGDPLAGAVLAAGDTRDRAELGVLGLGAGHGRAVAGGGEVGDEGDGEGCGCDAGDGAARAEEAAAPEAAVASGEERSGVEVIQWFGVGQAV